MSRYSKIEVIPVHPMLHGPSNFATATPQELLAMGYTHEYYCYNESGICVRTGYGKDFDMLSFALLSRGKRATHD